MSFSVHLSLDGPGLQQANTAEPTSFTITAKDDSGRAVQLPPNPFKIDINGPSGPVQSQLQDNGNGTFTVTYHAQKEGTHEVNVFLKSTVKVGIAVGTDASKSKAYGPGLEDGVQDNLPTYFTIESRGTDGQPMKKGGDPYEVKITGPKGDVPAQITDNGDGTYRVDYAPEHAGPTRIDIGLKGKPVANSPYTVNVKEGADHTTSFIESATFVIQARTKRNQNMTRGGEKFEVAIDNNANPKLNDLGNGQYNVSYTVPRSGNTNFSVKVNTKDIQGSPWQTVA